jgi:hypothetical protein
MRMVAKCNGRIALLFAIFLALFSTGIVIAHQCHSMITSQVSMQHGHSDHDSAPTAATTPLNVNSNSERLIDTSCAALFVVVLLFGRKLAALRAPRSRLSSFIALSRNLVTVYRPQVFQPSLSRLQLGVIRI